MLLSNSEVASCYFIDLQEMDERVRYREFLSIYRFSFGVVTTLEIMHGEREMSKALI